MAVKSLEIARSIIPLVVTENGNMQYNSNMRYNGNITAYYGDMVVM